MSKPRCDSSWNHLSPEQKTTLNQWLFDQNLGYDRVLQLAREHFGLAASKSSLARYYQAVICQRLRVGFRDTNGSVAVAEESALKLPSMRAAAVKLVGKHLIDSVVLQKAKSNELSSLASVLLSSEQAEIQRGWLDLARQKFHFDATEAALKLVPTVKELDKDEEERSLWRRHRMLRQVFGKECDHIQLPDGEGPPLGSLAWEELHRPKKSDPPPTTQVPENPSNPA